MTTALAPAQIEACARLIAQAYADNAILERFPAELSPKSLADAIAIQDRVCAILRWKTVGWKVGSARPEVRKRLGEIAPVTGRLFEGAIMRSPASLPRSQVHHPMFEGELAAVMGRDLPPRAGAYSVEEVLDAIDTVLPVIEFADIRSREGEGVTAYELTALNGGSFRLIVGEPIAGWRSLDLQALKAEMRLDGKVAANEFSGDKRSDFVWVMHFLANRLSQRGIGLRAGEYVATGVILDYFDIEETREAAFQVEGAPAVVLEVRREVESVR